ncbi:pirin family protein [Vibrio lamellibrachiae]|uniref:pirin family protein n=1 Tax=Vibrio lamellibrachiae TaxID=2910253 RepID=UPI003D11AA0D
MDMLTLSQLPQGGFAGLKEKQLVKDERVFGSRKSAQAFNGIGSFVYLADANFQPYGETGMHPHHEIDVISVMAKGRIEHAGSLEHGQGLTAGTVQVQRAGGEGFSHNEINPDGVPNQMIQLWVLPETPGQAAGYKVYQPQKGNRTRVYGGNTDDQETFASRTVIDVFQAGRGEATSHQGEVLAYLSVGSATMNGTTVEAGTLVRTNKLEFIASSDSQLILIYTE